MTVLPSFLLFQTGVTTRQMGMRNLQELVTPGTELLANSVWFEKFTERSWLPPLWNRKRAYIFVMSASHLYAGLLGEEVAE